MAQWTADKWSEYGFTSRLDEYCESYSFSSEKYIPSINMKTLRTMVPVTLHITTTSRDAIEALSDTLTAQSAIKSLA
jgi:hypothetical protein